jgi:hypothetical protein
LTHDDGLRLALWVRDVDLWHAGGARPCPAPEGIWLRRLHLARMS